MYIGYLSSLQRKWTSVSVFFNVFKSPGYSRSLFFPNEVFRLASSTARVFQCMLNIILFLQVVLSCGALQHFSALLTHNKEKIKKVLRLR